MLIPNKYADISKNTLSIGLSILKFMKKTHNLYELYKEIIKNREDFYTLSFEQYLITLDFLYTLGKIDISGEDIVRLWYFTDFIQYLKELILPLKMG